VLGGELHEGQWILKIFDSKSKAQEYYDKEKPDYKAGSTLDIERWKVE